MEGGVGEGRHDAETVLLEIDLGADSDVGPSHLLVEVALHARRDPHRVRIVQGLEHGGDRRRLHLLGVRISDVVLEDHLPDIDQGVEPREVVPPSGSKRDQDLNREEQAEQGYRPRPETGGPGGSWLIRHGDSRYGSRATEARNDHTTPTSPG